VTSALSKDGQRMGQPQASEGDPLAGRLPSDPPGQPSSFRIVVISAACEVAMLFAMAFASAKDP
jgi:hypothetical protein